MSILHLSIYLTFLLFFLQSWIFIFIPPAKLILALLLEQVYWQLINYLSFPLSENVFFLSLFQNVGFWFLPDVELWVFEHLKNVIPLPSHLHGFWSEIYNNLSCCYFLCNICFSLTGFTIFSGFFCLFVCLFLFLFFVFCCCCCLFGFFSF